MSTVRTIFAFGVIWRNPPRPGDIPVAYTRASPEEDLEFYMYLTAEEIVCAGNKPVLKFMNNIYGISSLL
jgi:hypothetical protein